MGAVIQLSGTIYEKGFGQVAKSVMTDSTLHVTAKAIYAYLCSFAGGISGERKAFPGLRKILADLRIGKNTFYKYLKQLLDAGYVTTAQEKDETGQYSYTVYRIEEKPLPQSRETVDEEEEYNNNSSCNNTIHRNKNNNNNDKEDADANADVVVSLAASHGLTIAKGTLRAWLRRLDADSIARYLKYALTYAKNPLAYVNAAIYGGYDPTRNKPRVRSAYLERLRAAGAR